MALPAQLNQSVPAGSDLPSTLDNRHRAHVLAVEDILGIPDVTNISAAGFGWDSTGLSSIRLQNAAVNPSVSGHLQRNGVNLMYHDGTSSYGLVLDTRTGVLSNKTLTNVTLSSPTITGATLTGLQGPITGVLEFASTHTLALNPPWRISASVAGNALTVAIKNLDGNDATSTSTIPFAFNTNTLTDSAIVIGAMSTAMSVVAPATATLGFTASQTSRIWVGGYFEAGACKPFLWHTYDSASSNYSIKLPGPNTVSTTAISTGADSAGVAYATAAITNAPWQWLGYIEIQSDATPGNWANSPTVQRSVPAWGIKPGTVIQDIFQDDGLFASGTTTIPEDSSIPQQSEGDQYAKQSITYTSAVNLAEIEHVGFYGHSTAVGIIVAFFQGSGTNALAAWTIAQWGGAPGGGVNFMRYRHIPGTAGSSFEYKVRAGLESAGTTYYNSSTGASLYGGLTRSSLRIREIMI